MADWLDQLADEALKHGSGAVHGPWTSNQAGIGRFFAAKFRSRCIRGLGASQGSRLATAIRQYRIARDNLGKLANTRKAYIARRASDTNTKLRGIGSIDCRPLTKTSRVWKRLLDDKAATRWTWERAAVSGTAGARAAGPLCRACRSSWACLSTTRRASGAFSALPQSQSG